jgi:hypothetical protein
MNRYNRPRWIATTAARARLSAPELANVKKAILNGLDTPVTKEMLLECAEKVDTLEAELKAPPSRPKVVALSTTVMRHLADLRIAFGRDNDRARSALRKLVSQVVLRRHGDRIMAEVTGNLKALLDLDEVVENDGAGRGISSLPNVGGVLKIA